MESRITVCLLGGLTVQSGERVQTHFRTRRTAALLGYLVYHALTPHRRTDLMEQFWPHLSLPARSNSLSIALSSLRPLFMAGEDSLLTTDRQHVYLSPDSFETDVQRFEALCSKNAHAPSGTILQEVLELYRGPLLPDCDDDWAFVERERIAVRFVETALSAAEATEAEGGSAEAIALLRRALSVEPLHEGLHRDLLSRLVRNDDVAAARRHIRRWERALRQSGDALPDDIPALLRRPVSARRNARERPPSLAPPNTTAPIIAPFPLTPPAAPGASPGRRLSVFDAHAPLPQWNDAFIGRREEKARLLTALRNPDNRLLTIVGCPGVGKTRFAAEVARIAQGHFPGGATAILLGDSLYEEAGARFEAALDACLRRETTPPRRALLLLDSPERLLAAAGDDVIARLIFTLRRAPGLTLLLTTRRPLQIPQERLLALEPFPFPPVGENLAAEIIRSQSGAAPAIGEERNPVEASLEWDAVRLFVDRAVRTWAGFRLTPMNAAAVLHLVTVVQGLPLAIEIAAARAGHLSVGEIAAPLSALIRSGKQSGTNSSTALTAAGESDAGETDSVETLLPPALEKAIGWSVGLLPASLGRFFFALAALEPEFTSHDAAQATGEADAGDSLTRLRAASLISLREGDDNRLYHRLPASIRAYALRHQKERKK